ncbi:MAG: Uma2 family endonuclease [Fimbriiglobus sp.]
MATVQHKLMTAEEYFDLPVPTDGTKLELIRGEVVAMPRPGLEHGEIQGNIYFQIKVFLKSHPIGRVFVESGTIVDCDPDTVRGPDVSYYSRERLPLGLRVVKYHNLPPDLCVEVVSPSNTRGELREKLHEYFSAGVREVWVVTPEDRSVTVYRDPLEGKTLHDGAVLDGAPVLPEFTCPVADLFPEA